MVDRISFAHLNGHSLTSEPSCNNAFSLISKRKLEVLIVYETHTNKAFEVNLNKLFKKIFDNEVFNTDKHIVSLTIGISVIASASAVSVSV